MARIKIKDLPKDQKISREEMKKIFAGTLLNIGDDAQLANIDLQNSLQKQQQLIQTLSNVSKLLSDTSMSVIRKIG